MALSVVERSGLAVELLQCLAGIHGAFPINADQVGAVNGIVGLCGCTHSLQSSSFLCFIFGILQGNPKKELLWSLWVATGFRFLCISTGLPLWGLVERSGMCLREGSAVNPKPS